MKFTQEQQQTIIRLIEAVIKGDPNRTSALLSKHKFLAEGIFGSVSPLCIAILNDNEKVVKTMLEIYPEWALKEVDRDTLEDNRFIISNIKDQLKSSNIDDIIVKGISKTREENTGEGLNLVHIAGGNLKILESLIDAGADIESKNLMGRTLFNQAIFDFEHELAKWLIDKGADINYEAAFGTPLQHAIQTRDQELALRLIEKGANIAVIDNYGSNLLIKALTNNMYEVAKLLIQAKINVNAINNHGVSALHIASLGSGLEMVELLIKNGADVNIQTDEGLTPLYAAVEAEYVRSDKYQVIECLINAGADVNAPLDNPSLTPSYRAMLRNDYDLFILLKEKGANLKISDNLNPCYDAAFVNNGSYNLHRKFAPNSIEPDFFIHSKETVLDSLIKDYGTKDFLNKTLSSIQLLISKGIDIYKKEPENITLKTLFNAVKMFDQIAAGEIIGAQEATEIITALDNLNLSTDNPYNYLQMRMICHFAKNGLPSNLLSKQPLIIEEKMPVLSVYRKDYLNAFQLELHEAAIMGYLEEEVSSLPLSEILKSGKFTNENFTKAQSMIEKAVKLYTKLYGAESVIAIVLNKMLEKNAALVSKGEPKFESVIIKGSGDRENVLSWDEAIGCALKNIVPGKYLLSVDKIKLIELCKYTDESNLNPVMCLLKEINDLKLSSEVKELVVQILEDHNYYDQPKPSSLSIDNSELELHILESKPLDINDIVVTGVESNSHTDA